MIDTAGYIAPVNKAALQKTNLVIADAIGSNGEEFESCVGEIRINNPLFIRGFPFAICLEPAIDAIGTRLFGRFAVGVICETVFGKVQLIAIVYRSSPIIVVRIIKIKSGLFASILILQDEIGGLALRTKGIDGYLVWSDPSSRVSNKRVFRFLQLTESESGERKS